MRRVAPVLLTAGLAATMIGCGSPTGEGGPNAKPAQQQSSDAELTLVTLNVPKMT